MKAQCEAGANHITQIPKTVPFKVLTSVGRMYEQIQTWIRLVAGYVCNHIQNLCFFQYPAKAIQVVISDW